MDGPDVVMPAWSLVRGYLSPATLFLLLNVVIGTIALSSRSQRRRPQNHGDGDHPQHQPQHHQEQQGYNNDRYAPAQPPAPLARTSSVMERLRSLGLYRFRSGDFPPEYNHGLASANVDDDSSKQQPQQQQPQYARSRSEPSVRPPAKKTGNEGEKAAKAKVPKKPSSEVKKLERAPAPARPLVQRAPRAPPAAARVAVATPARQEEDAGGRPEAAAAAGCVDARADDFINKFRQQLQLQRLNSLLNYKEMLNRGT
ncbi:uncharacterized protein LOC100823254 [Brachypodium distachyon]|uniref:uncharacterized protein LOC100823254 n=1 Tax=Brachypodium distachyon TaxID=15368 RepID=UPI000234DE4A|nr:uncharacterized protein LOC100823254 [Brachypodium distachyon]|eukprot:XP_003567044.1 uncharacterized protein LOC100823254 [Brachypodium distachyon]